jgi:imidazolonepropionase-like amidohydrolase
MDGTTPRGPQLVSLNGDRIGAIRPAAPGDRDLPDLLDLSHLTVVPGLLDAHTHLDFDVLAGNEAQQAAVDDPTLLLRMIDRGAANLRRGVTAVRLVGSRDFLDIALRRAFDAGDLPGPRMVTATRGITSSHSGGANSATADGADAIRRVIRENIRRGADLIKLFHGGVIGSGEDPCAPLFSEVELAAAVDEAHRHGRAVAVHAYGGRCVDECLVAGVDHIEHGLLMTAEQYDRAAERGTWIVPTLGVFVTEPGLPELPHWPAWIRERLLRAREASWRSVALLKASGARFALTTDAIHGEVAKEAIYGASAGLSNQEALAAVTSSAAALCGLAGKAGVVAPGAWADLLAIEGDPLEDLESLRRVRAVLKGGRLVVASHSAPNA